MKRKMIEATRPVPTKKRGRWITTQLVDDCILVLNIYIDRILQARHCINVLTGEYATLCGKKWSATKFESALGLERDDYAYYYCDDKIKERAKMSKEDEQYIKDVIEYYGSRKDCAGVIIASKETEFGRERREITEMRRIQKVNAVMEKIPPVPSDIEEWVDQRETAGMDFMMKNRDTGMWGCSCCGEYAKEKQIKTKSGATPRNNDLVICPNCGREVQILKRKKSVWLTPRFAIVQPIDDDISVVRHFVSEIHCAPGKKKQVDIEENIRIILHKRSNKDCTIYCRQWGSDFDYKSNPRNRREGTFYLYDDGIQEAFKDTAYEAWARVFTIMAQAGAKADYNRMMVAKDDVNMIRACELLFKGRFERLLTETSENISIWSGKYFGELHLDGSSIEDVFGIEDRQKINRIRDKNGGKDMLAWMKYSELYRLKISDKTLTWLLKNGLNPENMAWIKCRFSPEQAMNYIERQRKESYQGKSVKTVINQYEDYMNMCQRLHKDTADEMVYRPRELKRRHDEAVAEIARLNAQLRAEEYSKKFGEAEAVLQTIKEKFEYAGQQYFIMVPQKIVDIVSEGNYLHHCAGATDRYFDRIKQHETYICFLRKQEEPDVPFYTIEVEPGGTIRQHRGMFDEEPDIEKVKPFLKEWQKVIRKRMSEEDHKRAAVSKIKREENIEDLKRRNNTRVLNGLMEDFMEAVE